MSWLYFSRKMLAVSAILTSIIISAGSAYAEPIISSSSPNIMHGQNITISGSGFGMKDPAAPLVWDDAETGNITDKWEVDPTTADPNYNMQYRNSGFRNVVPPHSHSNSRFASGGHDPNHGYSPPAPSYDYHGGPNVQLAKDFSSMNGGLYASFYYTLDPNWPDMESGVNNKFFSFYSGSFPYSGTGWYSGFSADLTRQVYGYNPGPGFYTNTYYYSDTQTCSWLNCHLDNDPARFGMTQPALRSWKRFEHIVVDGTNGYYQVNLDNTWMLKTVPGDPIPFTSGNIGLGGYYRYILEAGHVDAFRYFDDIYLDTSLSRVILANNPNYSLATIVEPQIPSSWSNDSITVTANLGRLQDGQTAYLFVFDSDNNRNPVGFEVTLGPEEANCTDSDLDSFNSSACGGMDCNDTNPSVYPGAPEICGNSIDEDCSGADLTCHRSDTDQDGCVSDTELTAFIDRWHMDSSNPTLKELIEAIGLWKSGCP